MSIREAWLTWRCTVGNAEVSWTAPMLLAVAGFLTMSTVCISGAPLHEASEAPPCEQQRTFVADDLVDGAPSGGVVSETAGITATAVATPYVFALSANGLVSVNQNTGAVNFCVALQSTASTPLGKCKKLGAISTANLTGNVRLDIINYYLIVTNTATGAVLACSLHTSSGSPVGTCVPQQLQP